MVNARLRYSKSNRGGHSSRVYTSVTHSARGRPVFVCNSVRGGRRTKWVRPKVEGGNVSLSSVPWNAQHRSYNRPAAASKPQATTTTSSTTWRRLAQQEDKPQKTIPKRPKDDDHDHDDEQTRQPSMTKLTPNKLVAKTLHQSETTGHSTTNTSNPLLVLEPPASSQNVQVGPILKTDHMKRHGKNKLILVKQEKRKVPSAEDDVRSARDSIKQEKLSNDALKHDHHDNDTAATATTTTTTTSQKKQDMEGSEEKPSDLVLLTRRTAKLKPSNETSQQCEMVHKGANRLVAKDRQVKQEDAGVVYQVHSNRFNKHHTTTTTNGNNSWTHPSRIQSKRGGRSWKSAGKIATRTPTTETKRIKLCTPVISSSAGTQPNDRSGPGAGSTATATTTLTDYLYQPSSSTGKTTNRTKKSMGLVRVEPDQTKTPVCPTFLRGMTCQDERCTKRHDIPREHAMPVCSFFQKDGFCLRGSDCPFRHVKVNPRAMICPHFALLSFCNDEKCLMQHVLPKRKT